MTRRLPLLIFLVASTLCISTPVVAQSLSLGDALARAEVSSPSIGEAQAGIAAARGRAAQAGVLPNPELQVSLENVAGTGAFRGIDGAELTVGLAQRFERGGKRNARRAVAAAELGSAELRLLLARADLAFRVREAFAEFGAAQGRLALAERNADVAERLASVAQALVAAGRDPPLRALRARSAAVQAGAARTAARAALDAAGRTLASAIGAPVPIAAIDAELALPGPDIGGTWEALDVRIASAGLRLAQTRTAFERTVGASDITGQAGIRRTNETNDTAFVVGFSMPLALRDRNRGGIAASRAEEQAAEARLAQARIDAARTLANAQGQAAAAQAQVAALEASAIVEAREAVRLAEIGYRAGKFGLFDVLDAQRALNDAENALLDARLARARAIAALTRAAAR